MNPNPSISPAPALAAFIGIDWADKKHLVCWRAAAEATWHEQELDHTPEALSAWACALKQRFGEQSVGVCVEQSRGGLVYALSAYPWIVLYPINPKSLARYREAVYPSGAKSDPSDAHLAGEFLFHHHGSMRPWLAQDAPTRQLCALLEQRERLVDQRTALVNQLRDELKKYFPQTLDWLSDLTKPVAWDFLQRWPTVKEAQKASKKQLLDFFYGHQVRRGDQIGELHGRIAVAKPLHCDEAITASAVLMVQALCKLLHALAPSIRDHEEAIARLYAAHPDRALYQSLPAAGPVLEPRLLVALGSDRSRFEQANELQSLSGIAPVTVRSGKTCVVHFRWAANSFLRQSFHEWANLTRHWCVWAGLFYKEKMERGFEHHAAVRALAFKWQRILFRCWKEHKPYDEARYLASLKQQGSWLAARVTAYEAGKKGSEQLA